MSVRMTLSLDDDVAASLQAEASRKDCSLDKLVNDFLRQSLNCPRPTPPPPAKRFQVQARALNPYPGLNFDKVEVLLEQLDSP